MTIAVPRPADAGVAPATAKPQGLAQRRAVVTGSTSGIGLGIARALAAAGADVVVNGVGDPRQGEHIQSALATEFGVRVAFSGADLSSAQGVEMLIEHATREFGTIDILVNNAGVQHVAPLEEFPLARWDLILALNLSAAFVATRAVFAGMKARGWGRIVNIASAHGLVASPFKSVYVAAKHGLVGLTKVTALEGAESGVTCNAICPGYVWTPLVERQIDDQARAHGIDRERVIKDVLLKHQPIKSFATVDDMGALTAFLCSDAGRSITGAAMPVDGGWTAQ